MGSMSPLHIQWGIKQGTTGLHKVVFLSLHFFHSMGPTSGEFHQARQKKVEVETVEKQLYVNLHAVS